MDNMTTQTTKARIASIRNLFTAITPLSGGTYETRMLTEIINVLNTIAESVTDLRDNVEGLANYTESLHESLCNIEEAIFYRAEDEQGHHCSPTDCSCEDCSNAGHQSPTAEVWDSEI